MNQTTFLLHHLIIKAKNDVRLRERLELAPREYNGVVHLFVVAMGRLSFADVPEWVKGKDKQELEKVAGMLLDKNRAVSLTITQSLQESFWNSW
jgi:hypothetical protein